MLTQKKFRVHRVAAFRSHVHVHCAWVSPLYLWCWVIYSWRRNISFHASCCKFHWGRARLILWGRTIKVMDLLDASSDELFLVHSISCASSHKSAAFSVYVYVCYCGHKNQLLAFELKTITPVLGMAKPCSIDNWIYQILWHFYTWLLTKMCATLVIAWAKKCFIYRAWADWVSESFFLSKLMKFNIKFT